jgi:3-phosphoshikimate 1-carboxyvinyltransferase
MKTLETRSVVKACVRIPGSKSISHRALIASALAQGDSRLTNVLFCEDTGYTRAALEALGAGITGREGDLLVSGTGGRVTLPGEGKPFFLGNSGTSMRLLLSLVSLGRGKAVLDGSPRMRQRPIGALAKGLGTQGAAISFLRDDGCPPLLVEAGGLTGGPVNIEGEESSQYLSSLLLSAPYAHKDMEIRVNGRLASRPYVDMTLQVMAAFGAQISRQGYEHFRVKSGVHYRGRTFAVEGDASAASYFWAAAAVTGGSVATMNIDPFTTCQGDVGFLDVLEQMGCRIRRGPEKVTVQGGTLTGVEADMGAMPDMVPTLAAVALFARGKTVIRNAAHLRLKESDRLAAVSREWGLLGARVEELDDGLIIEGGQPLKGTALDPHDDHRIAMSLAVVGLRVPRIVISHEECVKKSFPTFWQLWEELGR